MMIMLHLFKRQPYHRSITWHSCQGIQRAQVEHLPLLSQPKLVRRKPRLCKHREEQRKNLFEF